MSIILSLISAAILSAPIPAADTVRVDKLTYIEESQIERGKLYHEDKGLYIGSFNNAVPSGKGIRIKADGSLYSGNFVKGLEQGYGRLFMATGAVICGEFAFGYANGRDTLYYPDGKVFIGIVRNNGATKQGKTYKSAAAADAVMPVKPEVALTDEDLAFLESLGYGEYDSRPVFGNGTSFFQVYIHPNFRYKESMIGKTATVQYEFVVGEDGHLRDIKIISSTDEEFSKELVRVLKRSPRWKPAMKDGKPVPYPIKNQTISFSSSE